MHIPWILLPLVFTSFCENNCKKLRAFDPKRGITLASWLRMITVRMTIDHLRKSKKELASLEDIQHEPFQAGDQEKVIDEEVQGLLRKILEELPTKDKLLIELSYIRELPPEEVAQILQISVGAFYTRKNRIIEKLKHVHLNYDTIKQIYN